MEFSYNGQDNPGVEKHMDVRERPNPSIAKLHSQCSDNQDRMLAWNYQRFQQGYQRVSIR